MAGIMAEIQSARNPKIIITVCCVFFWFLMGPAFLLIFFVDDAGAQTVAASPAGGQNFLILPSFTLSEEYNDNVYLSRYNKLDDYITRAIPEFVLDYKTSLWNWHLDLAYDFRYYAKGTKKGDTTYRIDFSNHTELINNFFFIDVLDKYDRTSLSTSRDFTQQSLFVNQTDVNVFTVNPYLMMRSESRFTPVLGYKYINTWYKQENAGIPTVDNMGYAEMITDLSSKTTFTTGIRYTEDRNKVEDYNKTDVYIGPKYTYAQDSYLYCLIGESLLEFQFEGNTQHLIWDAGITHHYSTVSVAYRMKSDYIPDPTRIIRRQDFYVATITKTTPRTTFEISAGLYEYRNAATNHLENTDYRLDGTLSHAISPTLTIRLDETIDRYEDHQSNTIIALWHSGIRFERQTLTDLLLTLEYLYTNSYSHDSYPDNYVNNRLIVGLTKRF
jgi:hypothetical protein